MECEIIKDFSGDCCFVCLEKVHYYYKFNCNCHNYLHSECIDKKILSNCLICKKKINHTSLSNFVDFELMSWVIEKFGVSSCVEIIKKKTLENTNFSILAIYFCACIFFTFLIAIPLIIISFLFGYLKKITNDFFI